MKLALRTAPARWRCLAAAPSSSLACSSYFRLLGGSDVDALFDALDTIAIGAFGALLGAGLIVYAGRASQRDA